MSAIFLTGRPRTTIRSTGTITQVQIDTVATPGDRPVELDLGGAASTP